MGNRECEWIGARLPLWVDNGDRDGSSEAHGERGDLTARERREIEQHLVDCTKCRRHRAALEQALGALAVAAGHLPVLSEAPSLWPLVEQRIANCDRHAPGHWPQAVGELATQSNQPWANLDSVQPLREAWAHDTLGEVLAGQDQKKPESKRSSGLLLKMSVAAAVFVALIGISVARQQWNNAQFTILANSTPLADPIPVPTVADEPAVEIADREKNDVPVNQLADAEPSRPAEIPTTVIEAVPVPKPSPNTRFGFDLEHGTPMPPDTREAKPVY